MAVSRLAHLGLRTIGDLLDHVPIRYEAQAAEVSIDETSKAVEQQSEAVIRSVRGEILKVRHIPSRRPRVEAVVSDGTATLRLVWFNSPWLSRKIHPGMVGIAQGKAQLRGGYLEMVNPKWEPVGADSDRPATESRFRPVYSSTEDMPSGRIEKIIGAVLEGALLSVVDPVRSEVLARRRLPDLATAYRMVHAPESITQADLGRSRLAYDELLLLQLAMAMRRWQVKRFLHAPELVVTDEIEKRILARLPFALTPGQLEVCRDIKGDLAGHSPMNRLLQGDVGSGKTAVAVYAMLAAVACGHQAVLLAPTEILAAQHLRTVETMLKSSSVRVALMTGSLRQADRAVVLSGLASGGIDIAVGTHAILQDEVKFQSLAIAVIDEQHRFGVEQRAALRRKGADARTLPHTLVMTATPIPRTLALTYFGDLEVSSLRGRLPGRSPAITRLMPMARANEVYRWVKTRVEKGEQAFVVVPAINESERALKSVMTHAQSLKDGILSGVRLGMLHGQMNQAQCDEVVEQFRAGKLDVLVATVMVEVGVDIPNATVMVIEHAEQFGLAQLHQLRGRVGRSGQRGFCVMISDPPTDDARARLDAIVRNNDGFEIAQMDLNQRGPGAFLGEAQSGLAPLRTADLSRDYRLLMEAHEDAASWIESTGDLSEPQDAALRRRVLGVYGDTLALGDIG